MDTMDKDPTPEEIKSVAEQQEHAKEEADV